MLGLTLTSLLLRELNGNDFHLSQRSMFGQLEGIRETEIIYPAVGGFPAATQTILHGLTGIQQGLFTNWGWINTARRQFPAVKSHLTGLLRGPLSRKLPLGLPLTGADDRDKIVTEHFCQRWHSAVCFA